MNKYDVTLHETYAVTFQVEAESQEEAFEVANEIYWEGDVGAIFPTGNAKYIEGSIISAELIEEKPSE